MIVYLLTNEQADSLLGVEYKKGVLFNSIKSISGLVLTSIQVEQCTNPDFAWVKDLPKIEFIEPKEN